jgi:hypothetical protein
MSDNILASSVNSIPHLTVWDKMIKARFDAIDLSPLLMYLIEVVPSEALPILGEQFDVLGFKGWALCDNDEDRRNLIRRAIELKRYMGTPWSVKEALKAVGYYNVGIQEGVSTALYDAVYVHDGTINYGGGNWAYFRLSILDLGEGKGFSTESLALIIEVVNTYKPARCKLLDILLTATVQDYWDNIEDEWQAAGTLAGADAFNVTHYYDGSGIHDGSWLYNPDSSIFLMNINVEGVEDEFGEVDDSNFHIIILPLAITLSTEDDFDLLAEDGNTLILENTVVYYEGE